MAYADSPPAYLGRLHVRFPRGYRPASHKRSNAELRTQYKDTSNIRSKYKGARNRGSWGKHTSGIPIFGEDDAASRANWSVGHVAARGALEDRLIDVARDTRGVTARGVGAENSHALGHGDYGTDHELSAPAASKAQNTEQLAIELGMREAARKLNAHARMPNGESLVHAKITDVLHPTTGHLLVRRFKLIRKAHADDEEGTVVFDHLMDGERLHISKDEAFDVGQRAHDALMNRHIREAPKSTNPSWYETNMPTWLGGGEKARKGMGGTRPPSRRALQGHQNAVLEELQDNQRRLRGGRRRGFGTVPDRDGVDMVGPGFTDARYPRMGNWWSATETGQAALERHHAWMQGHVEAEGQDAESLKSSGSLPSGNAATLMRHIGILESRFGAQLGEVAGDIDHQMHQPLHPDDVHHYADHVERQFNPRQMGVLWEKETLRDSANRAGAALREMERDRPGSGISLLTEDQKRMLMAAHHYRSAVAEDYRPVL